MEYGQAKLIDEKRGIYRAVYPAAVTKVSGEGRTRRFTASTEDEDRDTDVLRLKGWELRNYRRNPIILWAHESKELGIGVGKVRKNVEGKSLDVEVDFAPADVNPFADSVLRFIDWAGTGAVSVGFIAKESKQREDEDGNPIMGREFTKQELLEISVVNVPSQQNALLQAVEAGAITGKECEVLTKSLEAGGFLAAEKAPEPEAPKPEVEFKIDFDTPEIPVATDPPLTKLDLEDYLARLQRDQVKRFEKIDQAIQEIRDAQILVDDSFQELAQEIRDGKAAEPATDNRAEEPPGDRAVLDAIKEAQAAINSAKTALGIDD